MRSIEHFINGSSVADAKRQSDVWNPSQGEVQAQVGLGTAATLQKAVDAALAAQPAWAATNPQRRARVMIDLVPRQSLVKWLVDEGRTVFVISWVNPSDKLKNKGVGDYVLEGIIEAIGEVRKRTKTSPDLFAFCLGGTLVAIALAWLASEKRSNEVNSATLIGSLVDFADMVTLKRGVESLIKHYVPEVETIEAV